MHVTIKGYPTIFAVKGVGQSSFLLWFQEATRKATLDSSKKGKAPARGSSKRKASEPEAPAPSTSRVTTSELNSSCFEDSEVEDLVQVQASSKRVRPLGSMPIVPTTSDDEKVREKVRLDFERYQIQTPVSPSKLAIELEGCVDKDFMVEGFSNGFSLGVQENCPLSKTEVRLRPANTALLAKL